MSTMLNDIQAFRGIGCKEVLKMVCERLIGDVGDPTFTDSEVAREHDFLEITWQESRKRFLRKTSRAGRDIGVLLPAGIDLRHGAVLYFDSHLLLSVSILPSQVTVIQTRTPEEAARVAYELGNLHLPAEIIPEGILTPQSDDLDAFLTRCGFKYQHDLRRFKPYPPKGIPLPRRSDNFKIIPLTATD